MFEKQIAGFLKVVRRQLPYNFEKKITVFVVAFHDDAAWWAEKFRIEAAAKGFVFIDLGVPPGMQVWLVWPGLIVANKDTVVTFPGSCCQHVKIKSPNNGEYEEAIMDIKPVIAEVMSGYSEPPRVVAGDLIDRLPDLAPCELSVRKSAVGGSWFYVSKKEGRKTYVLGTGATVNEAIKQALTKGK